MTGSQSRTVPHDRPPLTEAPHAITMNRFRRTLCIPRRHGPGRNIAVGLNVNARRRRTLFPPRIRVVLPRRDDETPRLSRAPFLILSTIRLISHRGDVCENTATGAGPGPPPATSPIALVQRPAAAAITDHNTSSHTSTNATSHTTYRVRTE